MDLLSLFLENQSSGQTRSPQNASPAPSTPGPLTQLKRNNESPGRETRLNKMAVQVKEVLPQVPLKTIKRDLGVLHGCIISMHDIVLLPSPS